MKKSISDEMRLRHILDAIQNIENFSVGKSKNDLYNDLMYRASIERQLEIIGEAANNFDESVYSRFPFIPWPKIISFRHFIVHEYFGLDLELVWGVIIDHIPVLKIDVQKILNEILNDQG